MRLRRRRSSLSVLGHLVEKGLVQRVLVVGVVRALPANNNPSGAAKILTWLLLLHPTVCRQSTIQLSGSGSPLKRRSLPLCCVVEECATAPGSEHWSARVHVGAASTTLEGQTLPRGRSPTPEVLFVATLLDPCSVRLTTATEGRLAPGTRSGTGTHASANGRSKHETASGKMYLNQPLPLACDMRHRTIVHGSLFDAQPKIRWDKAVYPPPDPHLSNNFLHFPAVTTQYTTLRGVASALAERWASFPLSLAGRKGLRPARTRTDHRAASAKIHP